VCCGYGLVTKYAIGVNGTGCIEPDIIGSLDHNGISVVEDQTYILTGYTVQCEGIVTTWEFCYQILNVSSVTFYPSIWEREMLGKSGNYRYSLIHFNKVTFDPRVGSTFSCQNYTLPVTEQFTAPSGSVVGLYSNRERRPLLLRTNATNQHITTYQFTSNQSSFVDNKSSQDANYNIAIRVYLGKLFLHEMHC